MLDLDLSETNIRNFLEEEFELDQEAFRNGVMPESRVTLPGPGPLLVSLPKTAPIRKSDWIFAFQGNNLSYNVSVLIIDYSSHFIIFRRFQDPPLQDDFGGVGLDQHGMGQNFNIQDWGPVIDQTFGHQAGDQSEIQPEIKPNHEPEHRPRKQGVNARRAMAILRAEEEQV